MLRELRDHSLDLPVIAAFAPFGDAKEVTRLLHEVPGSAPYPAAAARAVAGGRFTDPAAVAQETVGRLRDLLAGVMLHFRGEPDERMTQLITGLAIFRKAS